MDIRITQRRPLKLDTRVLLYPLVAVIAVLFVIYLSIRTPAYEQILWLFVIIFLILILKFGITIIFPSLLLLSIVSRGVLNVVGDVTIFDVLLILLSGSLIIKWLFLVRPFKVSKEGKWFLVFLSIIALTELMGFIRFPELFWVVSVKPFLQFIEYILVFFCVINIVRTRKDIKKYVNLEIFCGLLLTSIIVYEAYYGVFLFGDQAIFLNAYSDYRQALKINPLLMLLLIPTFWFIIFYPKKRPYIYVSIPLLMFAFVLSSSRSLYLAVLGGIAGIFFLGKMSKVVLVSIVGILIVWLNLDFLAPKINEIFESVLLFSINPFAQGESSTFGRFILWQTTVPSMLLQHPFWGYGINGFGMEYYSNFGGGNPAADAHNQYLQILTDHGIIAFVLFAYLYFTAIKTCYKNYMKTNDPFLKAASQAIFVSLISFLFAFVGVVLLETDNNIIPLVFWFNIGLIYSMKRIIESEGDFRQRDGYKNT